MARPHVLVHSMASMDGRTDQFAGDVGLYYELAAGFPHDAVLAGSGTIVGAAADHKIDLTEEDDPPTGNDAGGDTGDDGNADERPLLVILDGTGRITRFAWLRAMPYWRDVVVVCAAATPPAHLELLARHRVRHLVVGADRVDLAAAFEALADEFGIRRIRVDSGGKLNGALLRAGLVDEVSVLLGPYLVGGRSARGLFVADDLVRDEQGGTVTRLELDSVQRLRDDVVWLRYRVVH